MTSYCGYISLIGRPNVGKSTLLNSILGQKISITSRKPQTTRHQIIGIKTQKNYQMLFVDTPGIHENSRNTLNQYMNKTAKDSVLGVDVILFLVEASKWSDEDDAIIRFLKTKNVPIIFAVNKVDRVKNKDLLLPYISKHSKEHDFVEICMVSALKRKGVSFLEKTIKKCLPEGPHIYEKDNITNRSSRFIVAERIREKLMRRLGDELPYALTVAVDAFEEDSDVHKIAATIWVNKVNHKSIVIGKKGAVLKSIGTDARLELEGVFGKKVFLKLWVKVREGWYDSFQALQSLGYTDEI